jgi:hypothetical protein
MTLAEISTASEQELSERRFDLAAGIGVFCWHYHEGMCSRKYQIGSTIAAVLMLRGQAEADISGAVDDETQELIVPEEESEWFTSREIYAELASKPHDETLLKTLYAEYQAIEERLEVCSNS